MDGHRFDTVVRALAGSESPLRHPSRRGLLTGLASGLPVLLAFARGQGADAKRKHRHKKKRKKKPGPTSTQPPITVNVFGCVDVGQACRGDSTVCCSGQCAGGPPSSGQPDASRCVAHDASSCLAGQDSCQTGAIACTTSANLPGFCQMTTGKASYCAANSICFPCSKDADCQQNCGPLAACIVCAGVGCANTGDRMCAGPSTCTIFSDRAVKTNVAAIDPGDVLKRVRDLSINTWTYTSDDAAIRHIGPMAQDFSTLFGVGGDDRYIHPVDGQGVALAAIQGLIAEVGRLRDESAQLAMRLHRLEGIPPR
jgi:hypothetical protein